MTYLNFTIRKYYLKMFSRDQYETMSSTSLISKAKASSAQISAWFIVSGGKSNLQLETFHKRQVSECLY